VKKHTMILMLLLCIAVGGCVTTALSPMTTSDFSFEDDEMRLWVRAEEAEKIINESGLVYEDEELENYLNQIANRLEPADVFNQFPFRIMVIKDPALNAFTFPNGVIYIHTGLLSRMDNEAQLATLIGHEMTHYTHRHSLKEFRDLKNKTAFYAGIQVAASGVGGDIGSLLDSVGSIWTMAAITGYSRKCEKEADMEGFKLMSEAGYDPEESPKLFLYLKEEIKEDKEKKEPFFFGSHPRLKERIKSYQALLLAKDRRQNSSIKNTTIFLSKIHRAILDNARLDLKIGRFKIAQKGVKKYLKIKPNDAMAYSLLGDIFIQRGKEGDTDKAKEYYQESISKNSSCPSPYKGIGLIHYKRGNKCLAKESFDRYLSLLPQALDRTYIEMYIKQCDAGER
jgi:beta-barrel assembly-enhancing protease